MNEREKNGDSEWRCEGHPHLNDGRREIEKYVRTPAFLRATLEKYRGFKIDFDLFEAGRVNI